MLVTNEKSHDYASYERKRAVTTLVTNKESHDYVVTNEESHDYVSYKRREP